MFDNGVLGVLVIIEGVLYMCQSVCVCVSKSVHADVPISTSDMRKIAFCLLAVAIPIRCRLVVHKSCI